MADLLKGRSKHVREENIRLLRSQGLSEEEAIKRAAAHEKEPDAEEMAETESDDALVAGDASGDDLGGVGDRQFVVVTRDFSGLGWAKKLQEEGETVTVATDFSVEDDPKSRKAMKQVGQGWVEVIDVKDLKRFHGADTYFIFAENAFVDEAKALLAAGQHVWPPNIELAEKMEHDRQYAVDIATKAGLQSPPTEEFNSLEEGIAFLDEHADTAYVFKPNDGKFNWMTFVPVRKKDADANRELYAYLSHMKEDPGSFILQKRIPIEDGLEVNCEVWLYEGEPFLANVGLEVKRKDTYDIGEMSGCAGDFCQFISLDSELVKQTVGKMLPFYKEQGYTGFADVNVIFTKDGTPYFLEVCNRFGYNSHPNMFLALAKDGFGNIIVDYLNGEVDSIAKRFRTDVGCSLTLFIDHPRPGLPVHIDDRYREQFYPFDGYEEDGQLLLTDYSNEIGIYLGHGKDIPAAWKAVSEQIAFDEAVSVPDMYYRWDLADDNYYNAPLLRMKELKKRGLL